MHRLGTAKRYLLVCIMGQSFLNPDNDANDSEQLFPPPVFLSNSYLMGERENGGIHNETFYHSALKWYFLLFSL